MKALISIVAAACVAIPSTPVVAEAAHPSVEVTSGRFQTLPGGSELGYDITGRAVMVRIDALGGRTVVTVRAAGLDANTTYPTHVHNQPCSATPPGGGHYQYEVGGPVDDHNEIWPAITTNRRGRGTGFAIHGERARPDAMSIVVHHPANTSIRLACLDLA